MTKQVLEQRIGHEISIEEYQRIKMVYENYPSLQQPTICNVAEMYQLFGMRIFLDMLPRARKTMELEKHIMDLEERIRHAKTVIFELEEQLRQAQKAFRNTSGGGCD